MMLTEETPVPLAALPVEEFKDHLRLGSGFADDGLQDGLIESYLRAAMAVIEGRIGKMLYRRRFQWVLEGWREGGRAGAARISGGCDRQCDAGRCGRGRGRGAWGHLSADH